MNIKEAEKNYIFSTKLNVFGNEFIVLREPTMAEFQKLPSGEDTAKLIKALQEIFPDCIIESSFTNEAGEAASGKEISNLLNKSSTTFSNILKEWIEACPFTPASKSSKN